VDDPAMQRVLVIGSPGAGKSTLARRLACAWGLPLIHLDREYFGPGWTIPGKAEWRARVAELASRPAWVMDGNYSSTFDLRVPRATHVIWLDPPRWRCLVRVAFRVLCHYGRQRADLGPDCSERFDLSFMRWIWDYPRRMRGRTERMLTRLRPDQQAIVVRSSAQVAALESRLIPAAEAP
jgi:adenylate kinase family enzyme